MERLLFYKIQTWIVVIIGFLWIIATVLFGMVVMNETRAETSAEINPKYSWVGDIAYAVADFPNLVKEVVEEDGEPREAELTGRFDDRPTGWTRYDQRVPISGYLLLSRIDREVDLSVVELVDLRDFSVQHRWEPDTDALLADAPKESAVVYYSQWNKRRFRVWHPLLTTDGKLIFHGPYTPLIGISPCGEKLWRRDEPATFHHSLNMDADGDFWAPSFIEPTDVSTLPNFQDDALTEISADGEILFRKSMARILIENDRPDLIYQNISADPLHTNDIQPVLKDGPYWKKGDVFVSARHRALVLLYRPSTNEVLWSKQGPWLAQHDVDILDDHRIAVFNNNVVSKGDGLFIPENSDVRIYDFTTDEVSNPYGAAMGSNLGKKARVLATSNGLMDFTESGHMIVEEDTSGRLLIYGPDRRLVAEYINRAPDGRIYRMAWSRYMPRADGDAALAAIRQCSASSE